MGLVVWTLGLALAADPPAPDPGAEGPAPPAAWGADRPARAPLAAAWDAWGWMRGRVNVMTDAPLDETGASAGRPAWGETRFVYGVGFYPSARLAAEIEVEEASAILAGFTDVGTVADDHPFRVPKDDADDAVLTIPRKAFLAFTDPRVGTLRIGAQTFGWGAGLVANDGMGDPDFGDPRQGNTNLRLLLATSPLRGRPGASEVARGLSVFVAGDMVLRDDNAWIFRRDLAFAGVAGARVQSPRLDAGVFASVRWQKDRPDPDRPDGVASVTLAAPVDLYARVTLTPLDRPTRLVAEAEGVVVNGHTTRPYLVETAADGARVLSGGFVGRLRFDDDAHRLTAKAEVGFATGDDDPRDGVARAFAFHSDYEVGLVLFEQLLPLLTARAADRASDPRLVAVPTPGARYTINQGQVTNAIYAYPTIRWRPHPAVDLRAGWMGAWSAGRSVDAFLSGLDGGWPVGVAGEDPTHRHLGDEALLGARYRWTGAANLAIEVGAEGSVFVPGRAFDALQLPFQGTGRVRLDFFW